MATKANAETTVETTDGNYLRIAGHASDGAAELAREIAEVNGMPGATLHVNATRNAVHVGIKTNERDSTVELEEECLAGWLNGYTDGRFSVQPSSVYKGVRFRVDVSDLDVTPPWGGR